MEYMIALWLVGQSTPVYVTGPNQIGGRNQAIGVTHEACQRAVNEALTLHSDHVSKARCEPRKKSS